MKEKNQSLFTNDFILITFMNFLMFFGYHIFLPTMPINIKNLGGTDLDVGFIASGITIASILSRSLCGFMIDKYGRKKIFLLGLFIIIGVGFSYSFLNVLGFLFFIRFFHGLGWSNSNTAIYTIAADVIPKNKFGEGMSYFSLANGAAMAVGPIVAIFLMNKGGFKSIGLIFIVINIAIIILTRFVGYLKDDNNINSNVKFSLYEKSALKTSIIIFLICMTYGAITGFVSLYSIDLNIENSGIYFTMFAIGMFVSRPIWGKLLDKKGFDIAVYPGVLILLVSLISLWLADNAYILSLSGILYGVGFSAMEASTYNMAVMYVPKERKGIANATFLIAFDGGMAVGSIVAGILSSLYGYGIMYLSLCIPVFMAGVIYNTVVKKSLLTIEK